jgi:hypothetical protein
VSDQATNKCVLCAVMKSTGREESVQTKQGREDQGSKRWLDMDVRGLIRELNTNQTVS